MSASDLIFIGAFFFTISIILLVSFYGITTIDTNLLNNSVFNGSSGTNTVLQKSESHIKLLDYFALLVFIGFVLGLIITSLVVDIESYFAIVYIIVLLIATVLSGVLSYVWGMICDKPPFISVVTNFPITDFILSNFGYFMVALGFLGLVLLFAKGRAGQ